MLDDGARIGGRGVAVSTSSVPVEAVMYIVIRKFTGLRSVDAAARRAESGIGMLMKQCPGFHGYYIFDAGDGVGGSVTLFADRDAALAANEKALAWVRASLLDLVEGDPEIIAGEVLATVTP
jgi:hypothetical protein